MLSREQITLLNDWHNYFLDIEEQGGGSPPSYNQEDIDYWNKWYKHINKEAKKSIEPTKIKSTSTVPFVATAPTITKPTKQKKQVATSMSPVDYEVQQESNYM